MTHGRNDPGPKRLTFFGRNDHPKIGRNDQAETIRSKRPRAETTRIRKGPAYFYLIWEKYKKWKQIVICIYKKSL